MSAAGRVQRIAGHLGGPAGGEEDIVIVSALRTPIGKAKRGGFKDTPPDDLLAAVIEATIKRTGIDPKAIGDICVGNVLQPGGGAVMARMGQFLAGVPHSVPLSTVNRQCSSGLQAVGHIAGAIRTGVCDFGLACGVESMSTNSMMGSVPEDINPRVGEHPEAQKVLIPMGITSENVAAQYGVTREVQDAFSVESHRRAAAAQAAGLFDAELVPVKTRVVDKEGNEREITVAKDEGVRPKTTAQSLSKLRPAFQADGTTTAGNSSQVSDGAACILLARRSAAKKAGLPIVGKLVSFAVVGVPPEVMGIGPAEAIPAALQKAGLTVDDIDVFEINEAFASQAVYCVKKLNIPPHKVNPKGGAIALGHPLGCTGARQVATLLPELKRTNKKLGVVSMCIGTGMGAAAVFARE